MVLITAANGNQGRLLVPKLLAAGLRLRACVRSEASAGQLRRLGVTDVVVGDISEPDVIARAVKDVGSIYHVGPSAHPRERAMGFALIDAAARQGVGHFVFSSVLHSIITALVQHEIKRDIEEHLISSGLEFTILQPANYMMPLKLRPVFERGIFQLPWSLERRQSMVDLGDVTDVAVMALTDGGRHAGATYELVGDGRYTAHDIGEVLSRVLGRPVPVQEISADSYLTALFGNVDRSQLQHQARVVRSISSRYSSHDFVGNSNVLRWLLDRPPTSFEQFVRAEHARFLAG